MCKMHRNDPNYRVLHSELRRPKRGYLISCPNLPTGQRQEPEFEKRSSGQGGEPGQFDRKPLVLSRTIFEKIMMAAKVFTPDERAKIKQVKNHQSRSQLFFYKIYLLITNMKYSLHIKLLTHHYTL